MDKRFVIILHISEKPWRKQHFATLDCRDLHPVAVLGLPPISVPRQDKSILIRYILLINIRNIRIESILPHILILYVVRRIAKAGVFSYLRNLSIRIWKLGGGQSVSWGHLLRVIFRRLVK